MGLLKTPFFLLSLSLLLFTNFGFFCFAADSASDYTKLVYRGCASQKFQDPTGIYTQNLKALMDSLTSQSSGKAFYSTTSGDGENAITGLYQCRGDLSADICYQCVSKLPEMADKLCGKAVAARVQLNGCYLRYEVVGFKQVSGTELLYKMCGSNQASGSGFEDRRDQALEMVENGVKSNDGGTGGGLFYTGSYQSVYVLGQCEGGLGSDDCRDCVKSAVESAEAQCGDSISGQIYLNKCYISYSYYPNGVPGISSSPGGSDSGQKHTQRTIAIAVGGVAALGFLIVCLMFVKSLMKKRGSNKHHGGRW